MTERILTVTDVAEILNLTESTLRWMRHVGKGPRSFKVGRRIAYRESDIIAYIDGQIEAENERLETIKSRVAG